MKLHDELHHLAARDAFDPHLRNEWGMTLGKPPLGKLLFGKPLHPRSPWIGQPTYYHPTVLESHIKSVAGLGTMRIQIRWGDTTGACDFERRAGIIKSRFTSVACPVDRGTD